MQEDASQRTHNLDPHFSNSFPWMISLEALRSDGLDALNLRGIVADCVRRASLRELEIHSNNALHDITICRSDNLLHHARHARPGAGLIPLTGRLVRAWFDLDFHGEDKPRRLLICPPSFVQLIPSCDPGLLCSLLEKLRVRDRMAKALLILLLASVVACSPFVAALDDDDDVHRRSSLVAALG